MDLWQFTPLHEAASKNRVEVCSLLLSHGADPTLLNCHSKSSVDMAPTPELKERLTCECVTKGRRSTSGGPKENEEVSRSGTFVPAALLKANQRSDQSPSRRSKPKASLAAVAR